MNDIKDLVIKQIRFCYIKELINILKQLEEKNLMMQMSMIDFYMNGNK